MLVGYARAVDGDTIRVAGVSVRLKGVAAPELNEAFGPGSAALVAGMVNGQSVVCRLTGERSHQRAVGEHLEFGPRGFSLRALQLIKPVQECFKALARQFRRPAV